MLSDKSIGGLRGSETLFERPPSEIDDIRFHSDLSQHA
jgi:hypothetical protein